MMTTPQARPSARQRLLDAADELFYRDGINATGVDAVVERADVAVATLYNQFGGKDQLVAAYLDERDRRWRADWEAAIAVAPDAAGRVLAIFDALEVWWEASGRYRGCAHVDASAELTDLSHPATDAVARHKAHIRSRLTELAAETSTGSPEAIAADLILVYEGVITALLLDLVADPLERARRIAAGLLH
jgi:AcrR family transcriptional regulator